MIAGFVREGAFESEGVIISLTLILALGLTDFIPVCRVHRVGCWFRVSFFVSCLYTLFGDSSPEPFGPIRSSTTPDLNAFLVT